MATKILPGTFGQAAHPSNVSDASRLLSDVGRCVADYVQSLMFTSISLRTGNKIDRDDREIPTHIGEEFARRNDMYFIETSAKEADNVEKLFTEIAHRLTQEARASRYATSCELTLASGELDAL